MGTVFLLHYIDRINPDRPARHYLEYTARRVEERTNDHRSGFRYRTAAIPFAAHQRGIDFIVARVWPNADRRDEKRLRDLHNNPRLCPVCNPHLGIRTKAYTRTSEPHDFTGEIYTYHYWRTLGETASTYGSLASLRDRPLRRARPRVRRDGTPNYPAMIDAAFDDTPATPNHTGILAIDWRPPDASRYTMIDGKPYDIDLLNDTDIPW